MPRKESGYGPTRMSVGDKGVSSSASSSIDNSSWLPQKLLENLPLPTHRRVRVTMQSRTLRPRKHQKAPRHSWPFELRLREGPIRARNPVRQSLSQLQMPQGARQQLQPTANLPHQGRQVRPRDHQMRRIIINALGETSTLLHPRSLLTCFIRPRPARTSIFTRWTSSSFTLSLALTRASRERSR